MDTEKKPDPNGTVDHDPVAERKMKEAKMRRTFKCCSDSRIADTGKIGRGKHNHPPGSNHAKKAIVQTVNLDGRIHWTKRRKK